MKVAVTGSSGLIGTALVTALRADGDEVIRLVRAAPAARDAIAWDPCADRGGVSSDILSSARVLPRRLLDEGYQFQHPAIAGALAAEL